jgi:hypothetical protein
MTISLAFPAVVAVIGALLYFLPLPPKLAQFGIALVLAGMIGLCIGDWGDHGHVRSEIQGRR